MDMLAEACVQENSAAQILSSMLGQQRQGAPTPPPREGRLTPLPSPGSSEDTAATHAYTRPWMRAEDDHLRQLAASKALPSPGSRRYAATGELDSHIWEEIARSFDARTPSQCAHRYQVLCMAQSENVKGPWCPSEDAQLIELVSQHGGKHWARIASLLPGRTGKQCRERWCNNLDPTLKKGAWTASGWGGLRVGAMFMQHRHRQTPAAP